jgi:hypothetical protein
VENPRTSLTESADPLEPATVENRVNIGLKNRKKDERNVSFPIRPDISSLFPSSLRRCFAEREPGLRSAGGVVEDTSLGELGDRGVQLEVTVGSGSSGVDDSLRDSLVVEGGDYTTLMEISIHSTQKGRREAEKGLLFSRKWASSRSVGPRSPAFSDESVFYIETPHTIMPVSTWTIPYISRSSQQGRETYALLGAKVGGKGVVGGRLRGVVVELTLFRVGDGLGDVLG